MRHVSWVRRQISLKPDTHTENWHVDGAGISEKVFAHYPGRSQGFFFSEKSAEVIVAQLTRRVKDRT